MVHTFVLGHTWLQWQILTHPLITVSPKRLNGIWWTFVHIFLSGHRCSLRKIVIKSFGFVVLTPKTFIKFYSIIFFVHYTVLGGFHGYPSQQPYTRGNPSTLLEPYFNSYGNECGAKKREWVWGRRPGRGGDVGTCMDGVTTGWGCIVGTGRSKRTISFKFISRAKTERSACHDIDTREVGEDR